MTEWESILEKIAKAKQEISAAERELETAIRDIHVNPRAEKTTISKVVGDALEKVKAARTNLDGLEKLIERDAHN